MSSKYNFFVFLLSGIVLVFAGMFFSTLIVRRVGANSGQTVFYWSFSTVYPVVNPHALLTITYEVLLPWLLTASVLIIAGIFLVYEAGKARSGTAK